MSRSEIGANLLRGPPNVPFSCFLCEWKFMSTDTNSHCWSESLQRYVPASGSLSFALGAPFGQQERQEQRCVHSLSSARGKSIPLLSKERKGRTEKEKDRKGDSVHLRFIGAQMYAGLFFISSAWLPCMACERLRFEFLETLELPQDSRATSFCNPANPIQIE